MKLSIRYESLNTHSLSLDKQQQNAMPNTDNEPQDRRETETWSLWLTVCGSGKSVTADSVCSGCLSDPASSLPVQVALGLRCELTKIQFLHLHCVLHPTPLLTKPGTSPLVINYDFCWYFIFQPDSSHGWGGGFQNIRKNAPKIMEMAVFMFLIKF